MALKHCHNNLHMTVLFRQTVAVQIPRDEERSGARHNYRDRRWHSESALWLLIPQILAAKESNCPRRYADNVYGAVFNVPLVSRGHINLQHRLRLGR